MILNPYRFAGSTQQGAFSINEAALATLNGAAIFSAVMSATSESSMVMGNGQSASGALSMIAESVVTLAGASDSAAAVSVAAESSAIFATEATLLTVDAADFDGTNDSLGRAGLVGAADSKLLTVSLWAKPASVAVGYLFVLTAGVFVRISILANVAGNQTVFIGCRDSTGTDVLEQTCDAGAFVTGQWNHVMLSVDLANTSKRHVYVNDVEAAGSWLTYADAAMDFTGDASRIAGSPLDGSNEFDGDLAEVWIAPGQYLDLSVESIRRRFISSTGKPVSLGTTGSSPTGTAPLVYLHLDDGEAVSNFAINRGSGGNFTVTGSLSTATSSPSD